MTLRLTGMAALIACLGVAGAHSVQAQRQHEYQTANPYRDADQRESRAEDQSWAEDQYQEEYEPAPRDGASFASYDSFDNGGYDNFDNGGYSNCGSGSCGSGGCSDGACGGGGSLLGGGLCSRPGQFFIGVDYLNVRSTFSESTAFITRTGGSPPPPVPPALPSNVLLPPVVNTFNELEYDYESSYRIYGGYRFCDCGGEIRFAFTRFNSSAAADSADVPDPVAGQTTQVLSPSGDVQVTAGGDILSTNSNVAANIYDLGFAKTIPLGSPAGGGCGCGDSCCDSGCGWCPAWDIKWSAGLRFANINWDRQSLVPTGDFASSTMNFDGGGARVGLEGTRYLGRQQRFAVFAKGNMSLLLGDVDIEYAINRVGFVGAPPTPTETTRFSSTQLIPVLDIEAGGTIFVTDRLTVSAGYLLSAWHDLGMRDTFDVLQGNGPTFDDANILGFDGFFARAEFSY